MRIGRTVGISLAMFTVLVAAGAAFVYFGTVTGCMLKYVYWRSCSDEGGVEAYAAVNGISMYYEIHDAPRDQGVCIAGDTGDDPCPSIAKAATCE